MLPSWGTARWRARAETRSGRSRGSGTSASRCRSRDGSRSGGSWRVCDLLAALQLRDARRRRQCAELRRPPVRAHRTLIMLAQNAQPESDTASASRRRARIVVRAATSAAGGEMAPHGASHREFEAR
eukprot:3701114-Prymnesium_polylepis.1